MGRTSVLLAIVVLTLATKPPPAHSQIQPDRYVLFVSLSDLFVSITNPLPPGFPSFGSIEAADYYVNDFAHQAGLFNWDGSTNNIFQAVMSVLGTHVKDRLDLQAGIPVENVAGGQIVASPADLFTGGPLLSPILTEFATTPAAGTKAWTGSFSNGQYSGASCNDWDSTSVTGTVGLADATDGNWIQDINQSCNNPGRIYGIGPVSDADFDTDGDVDDDDLTQWQGDYGVNADSDADGDGDSSGLDFLMWQTRLGYSGVVPLTAAASVPEPSSPLLLSLGVVTLGTLPRTNRSTPR